MELLNNASCVTRRHLMDKEDNIRKMKLMNLQGTRYLLGKQVVRLLMFQQEGK
jgi:hypothetical protein